MKKLIEELDEWLCHRIRAMMLNSALTKIIIVDRLGYPSLSAHYMKVRVDY